MPLLTEQGPGRAQLLIYGPGGSKKTWWACQAAEAGYNVLYINGDTFPTILSQLTADARKRIYHLDVTDSANIPVMAQFIAAFTNQTRPGLCWYDEQSKRADPAPFGGAIRVDVQQWDTNYVVVVDHFTALVRSINYHYALANNIDLADADKTEWEGYRFAGALLTHVVGQLRKLPCHLVLVAHETVYEKYEGTGRDRRLVFQRQQPISSSNPHGMTLAAAFQEVYYFYKEGKRNWIDFDGNRMRDAQSKFLPPGRKEWDQLPLSDVLKALGNSTPPNDLPFIDFTPQPKPNILKKAEPLVDTLINPAPKTGIVNNLINPRISK